MTCLSRRCCSCSVARAARLERLFEFRRSWSVASKSCSSRILHQGEVGTVMTHSVSPCRRSEIIARAPLVTAVLLVVCGCAPQGERRAAARARPTVILAG